MRGAKLRGNLYQLVVTQTEAPLQSQEIAAPYGLAMTLVLPNVFARAEALLKSQSDCRNAE
ncbi:MAG: hypothetical protein DRR11_11115 [Gammaproteobacteria bacterium]|nr:MAG: hypothetical protein DRR11_11115 [Gammaproteobacteria bacterium]